MQVQKEYIRPFVMGLPEQPDPQVLDRIRSSRRSHTSDTFSSRQPCEIKKVHL